MTIPTKVTPWLTAALVATATLNCPPVQAQSKYTMTIVGKAASKVETEVISPQLMEADGTVRGVIEYAIPFSFDGNIDCFFCTLWGVREATWTGTGAKATQIVGTKDFVPLLANDKGTLVGQINKGRSRDYSVAFNSDALNPFSLASSYPINSVGSPVNVMRIKGSTNLVDVTYTQQSGYEGHVIAGINSINDMTGWASDTGLVRRQGTWSALPGNTADHLTTLRPMAIDDSGVVTGNKYVRPAVGHNPTSNTPVRWSQGTMQDLGGPELQGWDVRRVNKAGQVLVTKATEPWPDQPGSMVMTQSAVWSNGQLSLIAPLAGYYAQATAMNDRGQVVGCLQPTALSYSTAFDSVRTFIWQNGVTTDLRDWLQAHGVTIPSTRHLYCPLAINTSGSILLNYVDVGSQTRMFVRFNAQP